ncbi:hypothetical protein BRAO375_3660034 [Bradyrhizobium sp. ORS 375]|nr:hypothetical protein BRAO375_3660034 [Bradyrhizobium sp. ORS 375]
MCAKALTFYANSQVRSKALSMMRTPALIIAILIGLSGSTAIITRANGDISMSDGAIAIDHFAEAMKHRVAPVAHSTPESIAIQSFVAALGRDDS